MRRPQTRAGQRQLAEILRDLWYFMRGDGGNGGKESQIAPRVLTKALAAGGDEAKRAFEAMMPMKKIDVATIEAGRLGRPGRQLVCLSRLLLDPVDLRAYVTVLGAALASLAVRLV
jgi:hypothetical protein